MKIYLHLMKNISSSHEWMSGLVWFEEEIKKGSWLDLRVMNDEDDGGQ